jgi:hypothetical protein
MKNGKLTIADEEITKLSIALALAEEILREVGFIDVKTGPRNTIIEGSVEVPLRGASGSHIGGPYSVRIEYSEEKECLVVGKNGYEYIPLGDPQIEEKLRTDIRRSIAQDLDRDDLPHPAVLDQYLGWFVEYHRAMKKIIEEGEKIPTRKRWGIRGD